MRRNGGMRKRGGGDGVSSQFLPPSVGQRSHEGEKKKTLLHHFILSLNRIQLRHLSFSFFLFFFFDAAVCLGGEAAWQSDRPTGRQQKQTSRSVSTRNQKNELLTAWTERWQ